MSTTLKILYILWMKLLNIWCKVVQALSLSPSGKEYLVGGSEPTPSTAGCAVLAGPGQGVQVGRLAHSLFPSLAPAPTRGEPWPYSQGSCKVRPAEAAPPLAGFLFGVIAVRVSTLRSGSRLVFGLFGLVRNFLFVFWFLFLMFVCFSLLVPLGQLVSL